MKKMKKVLSILLCAVLAASIVSGCKGRDDGPSEPGATSSQPGSSSSAKPEAGTVGSHIPNMQKYIAEKKAQNSDTVGWLQIPELGIDDVVVLNTESNEYYWRRNFEKQTVQENREAFDGVFYADFRSSFGDGSLSQLGVNTCVYGHAMTDDNEASRYNVKFGPLHDFRDPEIAKTIPYLYFCTEKENLAFEVFAVFICNMDNNDNPYNRGNLSAADFVKVVKEQVLPRSLYNYDVKISDDDKFLTLSTCIYTLPDGTKTGYPNTYYRYAIMGRLVDPTEKLKEEAVFTINENPLLDADGPMHSK